MGSAGHVAGPDARIVEQMLVCKAILVVDMYLLTNDMLLLC
jgi:hypothetical protein